MMTAKIRTSIVRTRRTKLPLTALVLRLRAQEPVLEPEQETRGDGVVAALVVHAALVSSLKF
jgi:hypothetical protein